MTFEGLLLVSFTPGLFWLWFFTRLDVYRPAPRRLIAISFLLGCVSTIPAGILNTLFIGEAAIEFGVSNLAAVATSMLLVVGPVEELSKFSVVRLVPYRSLYFEEPMDGLVYAAAASLGFASLENLTYVLDYGPEVMLLRAPLSTLAHVIFGSIWGYALGLHTRSGYTMAWLVVGGVMLAAAVHAFFNITLFAFPVAALALVILGGIWTFRRFRWGQRISPFRYKRNYPEAECPSCQGLIRVTSRFCRFCGTPAPSRHEALFCGFCKSRNRPDASYCTHCGDRLLTSG